MDSYSIPAGFLVFILDSDFFKVTSFCQFYGFNAFSSSMNGINVLIFYSEPELSAATSFCYSHTCMCFSYSLQDVYGFNGKEH